MLVGSRCDVRLYVHEHNVYGPTYFGAHMDSTGALFMCTNVSIVHEVCVSVLCVCAWSQVFVGVWYSVHVHVHIWYVLCVHVCLVSHAILCYEAAYLVDLILPNGLNVVKFRYVLCNMHCAKFRTFVNLIQ